MVDQYAKGWEQGWREAMVTIRNWKGSNDELLVKMNRVIQEAERSREATRRVKTRPIPPSSVHSGEW